MMWKGPRYSRTSIMRAETGHGCGLQMLLKHNFNQVCRLAAIGSSRHAFCRRTPTRYLRHTTLVLRRLLSCNNC